MKYTKKAYLTMTSPHQTGGAQATPSESNDLEQLVKAMINREEETQTPYTNQLMRLKQELNDLLQDTTIPPGQKLQILSEKFRTYRSFLKKAQEQRRQGRIVVPPTVVQSTSPSVPLGTPPPPPVVSKRSTFAPESGYVGSAVVPPTPPPSTPRRVPTTPMSKNRRKLQQRLQGLKTSLERLREEEDNEDAAAAARPSPPMTRQHRRRRRKQQGYGHPLVWKPVRFTRSL